MKTNRIPATYNVTILGESMTPQLSNMEKARARREATSRANSRARRRHRAQHEDTDKTNMKMRVALAIIMILVFVGSLAMCYIQEQSWKKYQQEEPEYSVYIGDGRWVTEENYQSQQWIEAHPEAFGMEG